MKNKFVIITVSAVVLGLCAVGTVAIKRYTDHKNRFIPASELQQR